MDCVFAYCIYHLLSYSTYICIPGFHLVGTDLLLDLKLFRGRGHNCFVLYDFSQHSWYIGASSEKEYAIILFTLSFTSSVFKAS